MKGKIIGVSVLVIILIIVILFITLNKNENSNNSENNNNSMTVKIKENNNPKLKETKYIEGLEIKNIKLTQTQEGAVIFADVNNTSTEILGGFSVKIILLDEKGNEINNVIGYIPEISVGNTVNLNVTTTLNIMNVYDIKFTR